MAHVLKGRDVVEGTDVQLKKKNKIIVNRETEENQNELNTKYKFLSFAYTYSTDFFFFSKFCFE